jgi:pimeloyl-ACP methyl ester carboxylesterase
MSAAEFVEVPGASHPVHLEQPEWLIDRVVNWLSKF